MGDDVSACAPANAGTMRWHASSLEVCNGTAWAGTAAPATCVSGQYCGMIVYYTVYGQATTYASPWWHGDRKIKNGYGCISVTGAVTEASGCDKVFRTTRFTTDLYNYNGSNPPTYFGVPADSYTGGTVAQPVISCPVGSTYKEIGVSEASATNFPVPYYPSGTDVWLPNSANEVTDPLVKTVHIGTCLKQ